MTQNATKKTVLVLWNQIDDEFYERLQREGTKPLAWDPNRTVSEVGTEQEEMEALLEALRQGPYDVHCVNIMDDIDKLVAAIRLHQPDVIFNLVEFFYDDENLEPNVAALYELFDIPYTGNPPHTLFACQRKVRTKLLLEDAGLPTACYFVVKKEPVPRPEEIDMEYPLIVKPARDDASSGIEASSVVEDYDALVERCRVVLADYEQPALVEAYIDGREIHAAILGNKTPEVLPLFEMEFDDSEFNPDEEWRPQVISYSAKWDPESEHFYSMEASCPAKDVEPELEARIKEVALDAYKLMGCRDYARVDMRIDEDGEPIVLEVNPNPDLSDGSAFMMCAEASGRSYAQTLHEIVAMALVRGYTEEPAAPRDGEHRAANTNVASPPVTSELAEGTRDVEVTDSQKGADPDDDVPTSDSHENGEAKTAPGFEFDIEFVPDSDRTWN